jgi:hypothetical protein
MVRRVTTKFRINILKGLRENTLANNALGINAGIGPDHRRSTAVRAGQRLLQEAAQPECNV